MIDYLINFFEEWTRALGDLLTGDFVTRIRAIFFLLPLLLWLISVLRRRRADTTLEPVSTSAREYEDERPLEPGRGQKPSSRGRAVPFGDDQPSQPR